MKCKLILHETLCPVRTSASKIVLVFHLVIFVILKKGLLLVLVLRLFFKGFLLAVTVIRRMISSCVVLPEGVAGRSAGTVAEDPHPGPEGEQDDSG